MISFNLLSSQVIIEKYYEYLLIYWNEKEMARKKALYWRVIEQCCFSEIVCRSVFIKTITGTFYRHEDDKILINFLSAMTFKYIIVPSPHLFPDKVPLRLNILVLALKSRISGSISPTNPTVFENFIYTILTKYSLSFVIYTLL